MDRKKLLENIFSEGDFLSSVKSMLDKANEDHKKALKAQHEEYLKRVAREKAAFNNLKNKILMRHQQQVKNTNKQGLTS